MKSTLILFVFAAVFAVSIAFPGPPPPVGSHEVRAPGGAENREARSTTFLYSDYYYPYYGYGYRYGYGYPYDQAYEKGYYGPRNVYYANPGKVTYVVE